MKAVAVIAKILTALATVAGAIYLLATYGDKIVAWCKDLLESLPKVECFDADEEEVEEVVAEEAVADVVEEVVEDVAEAVEEVAEEVVEAAEDVVADEADFEG